MMAFHFCLQAFDRVLTYPRADPLRSFRIHWPRFVRPR
jgi:hypothetical protein